jgi:16S rRNA processing protein RimM
MKNPARAGLVAVGRIVRAHGVRGAVKIYAFGDTLGLLSPGEKLLLAEAGGRSEPELTIVELRPQGKLWIGWFKELPTMDAARGLAGSEVFIPADRLPPLEEGEFYHFQLIGLAVETKDGKRLGVLSAILETGAHDVYAIDGEGGEILIPAVEEVICEVDLERKRMVVDLPEGLE